MWFWPGTKVLVTLTDGSTLLGTARFVFWPSKLRLADVGQVHAADAIAGLSGQVTIPRGAVLYAQTGF